MIIRLIGASMIIAGCAFCGVITANAQKNEISALEELIRILDSLCCELEYNRSPLPVLCKKIGSNGAGQVAAFFQGVADEMDAQIKPNVKACVHAALNSHTDIPKECRKLLLQLGDSLGRFDLDGELLNIQSVRSSAIQKLEFLHLERKEKGRTNQTLWICAGVAAAVLMI